MRSKEYEELLFTDDFMFAKILQNNPDICKDLIELLLGKKIPGITDTGTQYSISVRYDAHGVRLDVIAQDEAGAVYDIEMQVARYKKLPQRTRYYHGMLALDQVARGKGYGELRETYVIFLCVDGLMDGFGKAVYSFQNRCDEDPAITLGDGAHTILANAAYTEGELPRELAGFLDYLKTGQASGDPLASRIENCVQDAKRQDLWRAEYMLLLERDQMNREEGRREGRREGRKEGRKEGKKEGFDILSALYGKLYADGREEDAKKISLDAAYRERVLAEYGLLGN